MHIVDERPPLFPGEEYPEQGALELGHRTVYKVCARLLLCLIKSNNIGPEEDDGIFLTSLADFCKESIS
jgi:hypothetical protein